MSFPLLGPLTLALLSVLGSCEATRLRTAPFSKQFSEPDAFSQWSDRHWKSLTLRLKEDLEAQLSAEVVRIQKLAEHLPQAESPPPLRPEERATGGLYGKLPEVMVDQGHGAIFPRPANKPGRTSWFYAAVHAAQQQHVLEVLQQGIAALERRPLPIAGDVLPKTLTELQELLRTVQLLRENLRTLSQSIRYLEEWGGILKKTEPQPSAAQSLSLNQALSKIFNSQRQALDESVVNALRPRRHRKVPFLPADLTSYRGRTLLLPISTDISQKPFLREVEGALDTHWNQSPWARKEKVRFQIRWEIRPADPAFAAQTISLEDHLKRFPPDHAIMTTGARTHHVKGNALIFSPDPINARTLAHELGHLMGFSDCYFRTLSGNGVLGLVLLEWDNPLFPDDLMCDNTLGTASWGNW